MFAITPSRVITVITVLTRVRRDVITRIGSLSTSLRRIFVKRIEVWKKGVSTSTEWYPEIVRDRKFRSVDSRDLGRVVNNWFARLEYEWIAGFRRVRPGNITSRFGTLRSLVETFIVYGFSRPKNHTAHTVRLLLQRFPRGSRRFPNDYIAWIEFLNDVRSSPVCISNPPPDIVVFFSPYPSNRYGIESLDSWWNVTVRWVVNDISNVRCRRNRGHAATALSRHFCDEPILHNRFFSKFRVGPFEWSAFVFGKTFYKDGFFLFT